MEKRPRKRKTLAQTNVTGPMAERVSGGRRRLKLNGDERALLRRQGMIERAVAMFLDLQRDWTWEEMARELGLSVMGLKDLTKADDFIEVYNAHFIELGHDPRLKAGQQAIIEMLPVAVRTLRDLITDAHTSPSVRLNAIKEVFAMAGLNKPDAKGGDRNELAEFLKNSGVNIAQVNIQNNAPQVAIPPEFAERMAEYQVIDVSSVDEVQEP